MTNVLKWIAFIMWIAIIATCQVWSAGIVAMKCQYLILFPIMHWNVFLDERSAIYLVLSLRALLLFHLPVRKIKDKNKFYTESNGFNEKKIFRSTVATFMAPLLAWLTLVIFNYIYFH